MHINILGLRAFSVCRLVPLEKQPREQAIGNSETIKCIISKAILSVSKANIQLAVGTLQLCSSQDMECESDIYTRRKIFKSENTEAALEIDAQYGFNSQNSNPYTSPSLDVAEICNP